MDSIFDRSFDDPSKTMIILGNSYSGKTHFMVQELNKIAGDKRPDGRPLYDLVIFMTKSIDASPLKELDPAIPLVTLSDYYPQVIHLLKKVQDKSKNAFRFLVCLDDIADSKLMRGTTMTNLVCTLRNAHISTCLLIQHYAFVTPAARNSCHFLYITGLPESQYQRMVRDFLGPHAKRLLGLDGTGIGDKDLAERFRAYVGSNILMFNQRKDEVSLIPRKPFVK